MSSSNTPLPNREQQPTTLLTSLTAFPSASSTSSFSLAKTLVGDAVDTPSASVSRTERVSALQHQHQLHHLRPRSHLSHSHHHHLHHRHQSSSSNLGAEQRKAAATTTYQQEYASQHEAARSKVSLWREGVTSPEEALSASLVLLGAGPAAPKLVERQSEFVHAQRGLLAHLGSATSGVCSSSSRNGTSSGASASASDDEHETSSVRSGSASGAEGQLKSSMMSSSDESPRVGGKVDVEKKKVLAEKMLDSMHELLCLTWPEACSFDASSPSSSPSSPPSESASSEPNSMSGGLMPLRGFIREILRRSKSSCMTLKAAEWYLMRLRRILSATSPSSPASSLPEDSPLHCPRRAFLASLVLAHKFLHDRVYSNRAWAKVSGLEICEVSKAELALGCMLDWRLWVGKGEEESQVEAAEPVSQAVVASFMQGVGASIPAPQASPALDYGLGAGHNFTASPSSLNETTQSCSSAQSSPRNECLPSSRPPSIFNGAVHPAIPASTFSSIKGSFTWSSPEASGRGMHGNHSHSHHHHPRAPGSAASVAATAFSLSASMPRLSLDGGSSSWENSSGVTSGISPEPYVLVDKADDLVCIVHPPYHPELENIAQEDSNQLSDLQHLHPNTLQHQHQMKVQQQQQQDHLARSCGMALGGGCRKRGALGCVEEETAGCGGMGAVLKRRKTLGGSVRSDCDSPIQTVQAAC